MRSRAECCERLALTDLRPLVQPGDAALDLPGGTTLALLCWGWSRGHRRGSVGSPSICCQRPAVLMPRGCASIGRWPSCAGLMLWSRFGSKP